MTEMTRTEELLKLCEAAEPYWYGPINGPVQDFVDEVTPPLFKQLVELVRLQNSALKYAADQVYSEQNDDEIGKAIAAFNKFEGGK